jgi:esterase/lipase
MLELMNKIKKRPELQTKTITLLSPQDSVCDALKANAYLKSSSKVIFFEKSGHEVLNDIEKESAYKVIEGFLNENI